MEVLDKYFGSVCELDIVFNFNKVSAHTVTPLGILDPGRDGTGRRGHGDVQEGHTRGRAEGGDPGLNGGGGDRIYFRIYIQIRADTFGISVGVVEY